jgi:hypothetical protein
MALDLSSAPPPRKTGVVKAAQGRATPAQIISYSNPKTKGREDAANGIFQLAGFGLIMTKNYADAGALGKHSPKISHELALLSEKNEGVGRVLDYMTEAGPYAGLITAVMPLVLQVMVNHNMLKAEGMPGAGVVAPAALEAQVKADMARQTAEALKAQREAEAELRTFAEENQPKSDASMGVQEAA